MTKKASKEGPPTLANYSDRSMDPDSTHEVKMDTEKRSTEDPDRTVPPEERVHAYKVSPAALPSQRFLPVTGPLMRCRLLSPFPSPRGCQPLPSHVILSSPTVCYQERFFSLLPCVRRAEAGSLGRPPGTPRLHLYPAPSHPHANFFSSSPFFHELEAVLGRRRHLACMCSCCV